MSSAATALFVPFTRLTRRVLLRLPRPGRIRLRRRRGVLELGTHSLKLHVEGPGGRIETQKWPDLGLGRSVYGQGRVRRELIAAIVDSVREACRAGGVELCAVVGTAALRDARNGDGAGLLRRLRSTFGPGVEARVVTEEEEAWNLALGCVERCGLRLRSGAVAAEVGGGSIQLVAFPGGRACVLGSLAVGTESLAARLDRSNGGSNGAASGGDVQKHLKGVFGRAVLLRTETLLLAGGAAKAIAQALGRSELHQGDLDTLERSVRRHGPPQVLDPARARVFLPGLWIVGRLFAATGAARGVVVEVPSAGERRLGPGKKDSG